MEPAPNIHLDLQPHYEKAMVDLDECAVNVPENCHSVTDVIRAHFLVIDYFYNQGEGFGGIGPRDIPLLVSAVSRQWVGFGSTLKWNTVYERAATLLFGLVRNHAFYDANKRTAFLSTAHYLLNNKLLLTRNERELEDFTVEIAERGLRKYPRYREMCKSGYTDPDVSYISWYLKKYSRRLERSHYTITYRELDTTLRSFEYYLGNPSGNRIDVHKKIKIRKRRFLGRGYKEDKEELVRVCRIGFPGWSRQVSKGEIKCLRRELKLTPEYGIDSSTFYKNADDIRGLIASYEGALKRLAFR